MYFSRSQNQNIFGPDYLPEQDLASDVLIPGLEGRPIVGALLLPLIVGCLPYSRSKRGAVAPRKTGGSHETDFVSDVECFTFGISGPSHRGREISQKDYHQHLGVYL